MMQANKAYHFITSAGEMGIYSTRNRNTAIIHAIVRDTTAYDDLARYASSDYPVFARCVRGYINDFHESLSPILYQLATIPNLCWLYDMLRQMADIG